MLGTSFKNMLAHRRRLAATAVAVILGVSLIAGTLVLTDTINQTFTGLYTTVYQGTDAVVRAKAAFTGIQNSGAQRPPVDASLVASLRTVKGVAADEGVVRGYARLVGQQWPGAGQPEHHRDRWPVMARHRPAQPVGPSRAGARLAGRRCRSLSTRRAPATVTWLWATPLPCWSRDRPGRC